MESRGEMPSRLKKKKKKVREKPVVDEQNRVSAGAERSQPTDGDFDHFLAVASNPAVGKGVDVAETSATEVSAEEAQRRRRTLHELNVVFNSFGGTTLGKPRRRPIESEASRERRMELLYDSVISIFEIQHKLEKKEREESRMRFDTRTTRAPAARLPAAPSFFRLPAMSLFASSSSQQK